MAQPAQQPTFEGTLLKAGDHTSLLRERFFSLSNSCLSYWENEADARAGASPRGSGRVIDTEEWWPQRKSIFSQLDLTARASNESEDYDGCRFLVRLLPTEGGRLCCYKLVATSPAERMKWMAALVDGKHRPSSGTPFPTGDSPEASGDSGGDSHRGSGAASAGAAAPAMDMHAEVLAEVLAALPGVWATWNVYGSEKQVLQARQQADEEYMLLHRRAPDCWQLLQDRGNFYLRIGELRRADSDFTAALALYPTRPELWNDRSACRSQMCRHADALADTQEALRLRPTFAQALSNRGNAFRALGNVGAAKAAYDAALLIDPLDSRTWNNRGALQEDVGNLVAAELDLRRSLEIDPSCARAESNRQRIARVLQHADLELQPLRPCSPTDVAAAVGEDPWSIETFTLADGPLGLVIGQAPSGEVEIRSVQPRGQAEGLGIRPGGVVVGLNDASIGPVESSVLTQMVRTAPSPRVLRIRYYSSFSGAAVDEDGVDQLSRSATAKARAEGAGFVPPPGDYADGGVSTHR
ncbi:tetratricopeptide tpr_1 repeat-containing protein [Chrysochromulina tobinii]|uniref:Tetratricopeptide tpr_1 repeat-containing protein n=1 Tax=Chrysochromulina tobinii TaxID=1460289 RepID=A0A0M0JJV6_9EUKA|nr:tetratricopeptide tpr_1 repeat-containing protein [Chrysochromulina tobinii]|eukprot:KOO26854.1 tetratricopeptide tpr_1 repeat-containing protein [Chrysochromulina sp. CCMP291]